MVSDWSPTRTCSATITKIQTSFYFKTFPVKFLFCFWGVVVFYSDSSYVTETVLINRLSVSDYS